MLDTGFTMTMINPARAKQLRLTRTGSTRIIGIAGEERADVFAGAAIDLGGAIYTPRRMAALPSDRRRGRDGILGSGFFRRFVVEIDFQTKNLLLHEPGSFRYEGKGEVLPLHFRHTTPLLDAKILLPDRPPVSGRFEVDTGCDDALCVGRDFVEAHHLVTKSDDSKTDERVGVGGSARVLSGHVLELQLGQLKVEEPAVNFFLDGSPVDKGLAGHMGLGALRPFKAIFDYSRERLILEPQASPGE